MSRTNGMGDTNCLSGTLESNAPASGHPLTGPHGPTLLQGRADFDRRSKPPSRRRCGAVLAALLVCLLIVMLVSAALVRGLVVQQRLVRSESQRLQAIWLAESAVDRAIARLRRDAAYAGETWPVSPDEPPDAPGGVAVIGVETVEGTNKRTITVEARWPDDPVFRVLEQRQLTVDLVDAGES